VSTIEDKIVQQALREVLEAIYEQDFLECSYGFRPGRKAHEAVRQLDHAIHAKGQPWILEFDIQSYFDNVDRSALKGMLQERIADKSLMRLIGKCLHVGILEGEEYSIPEVGTVQGSVLSPVLGNIYLHYVLDLWIENEVKPRLRGQMSFVRYADDGVFTFEKREDAERVREVLGKRLARFGLRLNLDKTRLVDFRKPVTSQTRGKGVGTFDFLGFTLYWCRSRAGRWLLQAKTRRGRLKRAMNAVYDWCRCHRHLPVQAQHAALMRRLRGHFNYFGVKGNSESIARLIEGTKRAWYKWLNRRSQRSRLTWERFAELLTDYPLRLPTPSIRLWGSKSL
jgi:group II intron reverse transcriptase/maturase